MKRIVFITEAECGRCEEIIDEHLDQSIPIMDIEDAVELIDGLKKLCPDNECVQPQFAIIDDERVYESFPEERWDELTPEKVEDLLQEAVTESRE